MEKYYTPSIEEFHIGFEFEFYDVDDGDWTPTHIDSQSSLCNWTALEIPVRVKHLDRDDIESLGFKHIGALWFENKKLDCRIRKWKGLELNIWKDWSNYYEGTDVCHVKFSGSIKNKSELKKILEQLSITTNK